MIGIVVVSHGELAAELLKALRHVVGDLPQAEAIAIGPEDDPIARRKDISKAVRRNDSGDGVVLLTDMFGGTPSNLAISIMEGARVEVIAGVNLPMLVKLAQTREKLDLKDCASQAEDAGKKYICMASRVLSNGD
jgi:PTS system mannose-specific IIA component